MPRLGYDVFPGVNRETVALYIVVETVMVVTVAL